MNDRPLGWLGILRLGVVQGALGALVVLATSTFNRVMVVELAVPAMLPGALVALHYLAQMSRPRFGHGSDQGGRRTRWILGGMGVLAIGSVAAAASLVLMQTHRSIGIAAAVGAYLLIGLGVGACGTSLLALLASRTAPSRRAAAATITWILMIAGFVVTTALASRALEPFSFQRLLEFTGYVGFAAVVLTALAVAGCESPARGAQRPAVAKAAAPGAFGNALRQVWADPQARRFTLFIFVSMLAYSGQEIVLEPFAGAVLSLDPAASARLSSLQHGGALIGMLLVALAGGIATRSRWGALRGWTVAGCIGAAVALSILAGGGYPGTPLPIPATVFCLGLANGTFTVAAIGSMMSLAAADGAGSGLRMGLWGAAQAVAFALGGALSAAAVDIGRHTLASPLTAYSFVFAAEAALFLVASMLVARPAAVGKARRESVLESASLANRAGV